MYTKSNKILHLIPALLLIDKVCIDRSKFLYIDTNLIGDLPDF